MTKRLFAGFSLFLLTSLGPLSAQTGTQQQDPNAGSQSGTTAGSDNSATGTTGTSSTASVSDDQFARKAAQGGLAEVELGRLASQKAESPDVKQFAQQMVTDHTQANQQLKQAAPSMNVPDTLDAEHQALKDKLSSLSGKEFDREYMKAQLKDHQEAISLFRSESDNGQGQLKSFAATTLPKIEDHARMARDIASKLGVSDVAGASSAAAGAMSGSAMTNPSSQTGSDTATSTTSAQSSTSSSSSTDQSGTTAGGASPERHDSTYDRSKDMTNNNLDQWKNDKNSQNQSTDTTGSTTSRSDTGATFSTGTTTGNTATDTTAAGNAGTMSTQDQQSSSTNHSTTSDTTTTSPDTSRTDSTGALPRTASSLPLIGLLGLLSIALASILGLRRRMN